MDCLGTTPIIRAEGIAWPLHTFLDSHGFELRPDVAECRDRYVGAIEIVDDCLQVRHAHEARQVDWHSVIAVKGGSQPCAGCGLAFDPQVDPIYATAIVRNTAGRILVHECRVFTVNEFEVEYCEDCQDYGEWDY